ncbi:MAG: metallophosphoesterase [Erysipelotrichaceae bacterium]|nr:metallophosphoesterase [Erysipelotrichaceae bacterium]
MKYRKKIAVLIMIIVLLFIAIFYYYIAFQGLTVTHYELKLGVKESIRIVHLTDLHNAQFGENNEELVELIKAQEPDLIFMSGDMLNNDDSNEDIMLGLISNIKDVAPIYFGYGNHECSWEKRFKKTLKHDIEAAGATVVNNNYIDFEFKGTELRLGGYMGYWHQPHMFTENKNAILIEKEFADDFENTERIKLLINHIPTQWVDWNYIDKYEIDAVFSGHYHGGIIRIPIVDRGVFAPYVGWFPPRTKGMYTGEKASCILSAGLGSEHLAPRINNSPEIVVIDLVPEN